MYAVIANGGKQYRVVPGQELALEKFDGEVGDKLHISHVLMVADGEDVACGNPVVDKATVTAEIVAHGRAKKIKILKFKRRKHHMKRMGHRQDFTKVKIIEIKYGSKSATQASEAKAAPATPKAAPKKAAEGKKAADKTAAKPKAAAKKAPSVDSEKTSEE